MESVLTLLLTYKYAILFPLSVIEGPIITVIAGFLVTLGLMNPFLVYIISVAGDVVGDTLVYILGRWGKNVLYRHGHYIGITKEKLENAKGYFESKHRKAIMMSKLIHGIGFTGLIAAGALGVSYARYFKTCLVITIVQSVFFLMIGLLFGHAYLQIEKYLSNFAAVVSVAAVAGILFLVFYHYVDFSPLKKKIIDMVNR